MLECIYPSIAFLFHILICRRQSQNMSLMFFSIVFGVTRDMKKRLRSSLGSWTIILISPIRQYIRINAIPSMNGSTKSLYPVRNLSLTSVFFIYFANAQYKMAGVYASGAYHIAFSAQHTALDCRNGFFFFSPLKVVKYFPYTHSREFSCRTSSTA